jgi:hypothetical protein
MERLTSLKGARLSISAFFLQFKSNMRGPGAWPDVPYSQSRSSYFGDDFITNRFVPQTDIQKERQRDRHAETERKTDRQTDRQKGRQTDRQRLRDRQTDRGRKSSRERERREEQGGGEKKESERASEILPKFGAGGGNTERERDKIR